MSRETKHRLASAALIIGFFVAWEVICRVFNISSIVLPKPSEILTTLVARMPAIWPHAAQTLYETLVGFGVGVAIGVVIGVVVGSSKLAYDVAYPLLKIGRAHV